MSAVSLQERTELSRDEMAFVAGGLGDTALGAVDGFGLLAVASDQPAGRRSLTRRGLLAQQRGAEPLEPALVQALADLSGSPVRYDVLRSDARGRFGWTYGVGTGGTAVVAGPLPRREPGSSPESYVVGRCADLREHVRVSAGLADRRPSTLPDGPVLPAVPGAAVPTLVVNARDGRHAQVEATLAGLGWTTAQAARFTAVYAGLQGVGLVHRQDRTGAPVVRGSRLEWAWSRDGAAYVIERPGTGVELLACTLDEVRGELDRILGRD